MTRRIAFLGPAGTFTEQAAIAYDPGASYIATSSVNEAVLAMQRGEADEAVVPMENSLQGSVTGTLDLLIHESGLFIRSELVLAISHSLLSAADEKLEDLEVVYSHPQALAQCRQFLSKNLPKAQPMASLSTAAAVEALEHATVPAAAIAAERASSIYGVPVIARGIEDNPNNVTRFVALGPSDSDRTGNDKTSLCWSHDADLPGLLYGVLREFSDRKINLTKIESRPTRESLGRYYFLADVQGHRTDSNVAGALGAVESQQGTTLKILGSYPRSEVTAR